MRILVADQNALLLAAITATFGRHCDLVTASGREECLEHAERQTFDVVVAGDKLVDYTGLELLSEIAGRSPQTLLVLAASPARLKRLGSRLQLFGLLETIDYPLTPRKLLETLQRARRSLPPKNARPSVRHVVLETEWDTGERLGLIERELETRLADPVIHEGWVTPDVSTAVEIAETYGDNGLIHGTLDTNARPAAPVAQIGFETEAALDDFVFAPPPARPAGRPEESAAEIELPLSTVPVAQGAGADDSQDVELAESDPEDAEELVSNDSSFDQPEVPPEPQWAQDGAANDMAFESKSQAASVPPASRHADPRSNKVPPGSQQAAQKSAEAVPPGVDKRPKVRRPTQPTAAQLEAFQRALARRNAERSGQVAPTDRAAATAGPIGRGSAGTGASWTVGSSKSLSELARMAAGKRPLAMPKLRLSGTPPKRAAFVVGSGLAAVLIVGALFFELLRTPSGATEHLARAPQTPFAASRNTVQNSLPPDDGEHFTPAPPPQQPAPQQVEQSADAAQPAQTSFPEGYDAYGNPIPSPPPAVERPGPMEPPSTSSMDIVRGPPAGMMPPGYDPQPQQ
jgi:CheY-like chemotaxis protein